MIRTGNSLSMATPIMSTNDDTTFSRLMAIHVPHSQQLTHRKSDYKIEVETDRRVAREQVTVRLADPNDPFFLYMIAIDEQLFIKIKSTENLLIDFAMFPKTLINLFETCFDEQNKDNPRFMLTINQMNKDFVILDIIEKNVFKNLVHLSLRISAANQEFIKTSFTNSYRNLKHENQRLESSLQSIELKLNDLNLSKTRDLELIDREYKSQMTELELKYKKEIEIQRDQINELTEKDIHNRELMDELRNELAANMEAMRRDQQRDAEKDMQMIDDMNQKVRSLEQQVSQLRDALDTERHDTQRYKQMMDEKQELFDEMNANNNSLTLDLSKANEIIRKLQTELQTTHQKLQLLNKVTSKQEEVVDHHQTAVQKIESELKQCSQQLKIKDKEHQTLRKDFEALKSKCIETENQLNANENIVTYLNKQLSELQSKHGIKTIDLAKGNQTNPKIIAQRNTIFSSKTSKSDKLFRH
ncbi:spindle assembly abnormal protein 6 homolog [Oppia nitens]|uniref:spindle assembly abnormal protein 6 homolog n=1 Tax=Oppia nitens TaxID=1686743 RepID=UPI0023DBCB10|nr:spindle assembly abnormal protein 6 homolog [Oppia nitens]